MYLLCDSGIAFFAVWAFLIRPFICTLASVPGGLLSGFCSALQPDSKFHDGSHYLDAQYRLCLYLP
jgi:hypothetical protein